ncbi:hypothetical protein T03_670 [Trichinella britovi]|uniref:Uncharacterized protein n=1 Tax=Trichinella britovi TaxID=45882 RepID=A0A0V1C6X5_TRIBR|nr:hypothetical protein T03_670 [Trichinella britovi]
MECRRAEIQQCMIGRGTDVQDLNTSELMLEGCKSCYHLWYEWTAGIQKLMGDGRGWADTCGAVILLVKSNRWNGRKLQHCEWILDRRAGGLILGLYGTVDELKIMRRGYRFSMWGSDSILESIVECGGRT